MRDYPCHSTYNWFLGPTLQLHHSNKAFCFRPNLRWGCIFFFWGERQLFWCLLHTWRILPLSKWLITTVIVSPLIGIIPLPNGLFMAYKWGWSKILTIPGMILQVTIRTRTQSPAPQRFLLTQNKIPTVPKLPHPLKHTDFFWPKLFSSKKKVAPEKRSGAQTCSTVELAAPEPNQAWSWLVKMLTTWRSTMSHEPPKPMEKYRVLGHLKTSFFLP